MPNLLTRVILFLSSYIPLFVVFAVLLWKQDRRTAWALIVLCGVALLGLVGYLKWVQRFAPTPLEVQSVRSKDGETMSYIASYILPFVSLPYGDYYKLAAIVIFLAVLAIVYVNSNMLYINPMLNLFGFHLYAVTSIGDVEHTVIARRRPRPGAPLRLVTIGENVHIEKSDA
jgi:hypothetical protein